MKFFYEWNCGKNNGWDRQTFLEIRIRCSWEMDMGANLECIRFRLRLRFYHDRDHSDRSICWVQAFWEPIYYSWSLETHSIKISKGKISSCLHNGKIATQRLVK